MIRNDSHDCSICSNRNGSSRERGGQEIRIKTFEMMVGWLQLKLENAGTSITLTRNHGSPSR